MRSHTKGAFIIENNATKCIKIHSEDNHFKNQFLRAFEAFLRQPQTMKEVSVATGIDRANICRYCRLMRRSGTIAIVKKTYCSITKHLANKYTTNPDSFPLNQQLSLFDAREGRVYE
jgi:hypothetical protein